MTHKPHLTLSLNDLCEIIRIAKSASSEASLLNSYVSIKRLAEIKNLHVEDRDIDPDNQMASDAASTDLIADVPAELADVARAIYAVVEGDAEDGTAIPLALPLGHSPQDRVVSNQTK